MPILNWKLETAAGTFHINQTRQGRYNLSVDGKLLDNLHSPAQAAHMVTLCMSGHWPWDQQLKVDFPLHLSDWTENHNTSR